MAAAAGRYYGEGGRATKRQKTEDGGMTTVRIYIITMVVPSDFARGLLGFAVLKGGMLTVSS